MKKLNWIFGWLNVAFAIIDIIRVVTATDYDYLWLLLINVAAAAICLMPEDHD